MDFTAKSFDDQEIDVAETAIPGQIVNITVPTTLEISPSSGFVRKTIVVSAVNNNDALQVIGYSDNENTADLFLAVPIRRAAGIESYEYAQFSTMYSQRESAFVVSVCDVDANIPLSNTASFFASLSGVTPQPSVRARKDGGGEVILGTHGQTPTVISALSNFDTIYVASISDLTGFRVSTTVPSGVMIGHHCGQVPSIIASCDYLIEQSPPSYTWGYHFFVAPLEQRSTGYIVKVIPRFTDVTTVLTYFCEGDSDLTQLDVIVDGSTIDMGEPVNCYFSTTRPSALVQYAKGQQSDDNLSGMDNDIGDPAMAWIPSVGQFINKVTFITGFDTDFENYHLLGEYVNVIVPAVYYNSSMIKMDGSILSNSWNEVSCFPGEICAYSTSVQMQNGIHTISHDNLEGRLSVLVYGWSNQKGYMYPAGYAMSPIGGTELSI